MKLEQINYLNSRKSFLFYGKSCATILKLKRERQKLKWDAGKLRNEKKILLKLAERNEN